MVETVVEELDQESWEDEEDTIALTPMPPDIRDFLLSRVAGLSLNPDAEEWMNSLGLTSYQAIMTFGNLSYHDLFMNYDPAIIKDKKRDVKRIRSFAAYTKALDPPV